MRLLSVQDALLFRFQLIIPAIFRNFAAINKVDGIDVQEANPAYTSCIETDGSHEPQTDEILI